MWIAMMMAALMLGVAFEAGSAASDEKDSGDEGQPDPDVPEQDFAEPILPVAGDEGAADDEPDDAVNDNSFSAFRVSSEDTVVGTDDDEVFLLDPDPEVVETSFGRSVVQNLTLDGGAGDDDMYLYEDDAIFSLIGGTVSGGAGDDVIRASGVAVTIDGGEGNDTIESPAGGRLWASVISGGSGDDEIDVSFQNGDGDGTIDGGAGNDYIDIRDSVNTNTIPLGGEGDDTIHVGSNLEFGGTGYVTGGDGGDGDDLLLQDADIREALQWRSDQTLPMRMTGGAGADTFQLTTTAGSGLYDSYDGAPDVLSHVWMDVQDFEVGTDIILFDLSATEGVVYSATEAQMTEDSATGQTRISVSLESAGTTDQEMIITVNATGLDWDDVNFIGASPTLEPLPA